ncbi:MAG: complex I NDUFA9 subunit family protein [Hyphomicrobiales bacterium]
MAKGNSEKLVTIIGGSGFVGRHIVRALAGQGYRIRCACRRPDLAGHLQPLGNVGQIQPVQANVRYPESVEAVCAGSDAVINCVGILAPSGQQTFSSVQAHGAEVCARAAKAASAKTYIQVSAIGADDESEAAYARTKAEGEERASSVFPDTVILRPSIVFGPEDDFFNRFAAMARYSPALPLIGGGHTRFQPVFAGDIAKAVCAVLDGKASAGSVYELGGPEVMSFREVLEFILKHINRKRLFAPLPFPVAKFIAMFTQIVPGAPLTVDQVRMLESDNVVSDEAIAEARTFEALGIAPEGVEAIVPDYLERFRPHGQFENVQA